jgi:hypothetical protein
MLRTDFSDDAAWEKLCAACQEPVGEFRAYLSCVSDLAFEGLTVEKLVQLARRGSPHGFVFVADRTALTRRHHPVLVVDLRRELGRTFRVIPSKMQSVENNLSIANMDFHEFADNVGKDGIFRGFPDAKDE